MNNTNTQDTSVSSELAAEIEAQILLEETEATALEKLTSMEAFGYQKFWKIQVKLNDAGLPLVVDFANTVEEFGEEAIKSSNLQLVPATAKEMRTKSVERMTWDQQLMMIEAIQITEKADQEFVNHLIDQLKVIW